MQPCLNLVFISNRWVACADPDINHESILQQLDSSYVANWDDVKDKSYKRARSVVRDVLQQRSCGDKQSYSTLQWLYLSVKGKKAALRLRQGQRPHF